MCDALVWFHYEECCCLVMLCPSSPDRRLPSCTDSVYTPKQCRVLLNVSCLDSESPYLLHPHPVWLQDIDLWLAT